MRDWTAYVRTRLTLPVLVPERQARIVRELAVQLEDFYRDARAQGATDADADAHARAQIADWTQLAVAVQSADRSHHRPGLERLADSLHQRPQSRRGGLPMIANAIRDARYAVRQLLKTPGFTITAVLTLALGIGASTAIFSVVNGVLLRPMPFADPGAVVRVNEIVPKIGRFSVAPATFLDWRQQNTVFSRLTAYTGSSATFTADGEDAVRISGVSVSWDLFELLGVAPQLGTTFVADQDVPGKNDVIVLSHALWQQRYAGDPHIVGRVVTVDGAPVTIAGVMPEAFYFPTRAAQFWRPIALDTAKPTRGGHYLAVVGRIKPGTTLQQSSTEMRAISERLALQYPESAGETAEVLPLQQQAVGGIRSTLLTLFASVGIVVLIACANVANLLLVRASAREREMAIRNALGASRGRIVTQMLIESLVLSVTGGALGTALAYGSIIPIQTLSAGSIPRVSDVAIDGSVLAFTLTASLLTGILFGMAPAWQASRRGLAGVLKAGGRSSVGAGGARVRAALLVGETALSIVLLVGAALLLRSFDRLTAVSPGFQTDNVLAFQVSLPSSSYSTDAARSGFFDRLIERLDALPDVRAAGMVQSLPLRGDYLRSFDVVGRPKAKPGTEESAGFRSISPGYFEALGIPLERGRSFTGRDVDATVHVAAVDNAFVHRYFPNEDPIGHQISIGTDAGDTSEIVGVVGSVHSDGLDTTPAPTMYVPYAQSLFSTMWMAVRTGGDAPNLSGNVRQALREIDHTLPAYSMLPLTTVVSQSVAQQRFSMILLGAFAIIALFLAAVGLYGVVAYSVSQRTREIGLRMAIGAQRGDIVRMIVGGGMRLALAGVAVGLTCAVIASQLMTSMLFGGARSIRSATC